jgi:hypothetical protein
MLTGPPPKFRNSGHPPTAARVGLGPTGDDHRYPGGLDHRGADRTQQHPGEPAAAVAADDDQLRGLGLLEQLVRRAIAYDDAAHLDVRVVFLPSGKPFSQDFLCRGFDGRPVETGELEHFGVTPGMQGDQFHSAARRFVEGDRGGRLRCG